MPEIHVRVPERFPGRGEKRWTLLSFALLFLVCAWWINLNPFKLLPPDGGHWERVGAFFTAALNPALDYEDDTVPDDAEPLLWKACKGLLLTLRFAFGAMSLAVPMAIVLGFLGSSAWWPEPCGVRLRFFLGAIFGVTRFLMSLLRSIHELIWALLILSAVGVSPLAGIFALALPFSGTLGKVFAELIDEEARDAAEALRSIGHGPVQTFLVGILPRVFPNLVTYAFYRFECALRSSAVLGFVGIETIGLYIELSHEEAHYREVWTYLYLLVALLVMVDLWGAAIRRRLQSDPGGCAA